MSQEGTTVMRGSGTHYRWGLIGGGMSALSTLCSPRQGTLTQSFNTSKPLALPHPFCSRPHRQTAPHRSLLGGTHTHHRQRSLLDDTLTPQTRKQNRRKPAQSPKPLSPFRGLLSFSWKLPKMLAATKRPPSLGTAETRCGGGPRWWWWRGDREVWAASAKHPRQRPEERDKTFAHV
jgi:hypothetical protein